MSTKDYICVFIFLYLCLRTHTYRNHMYVYKRSRQVTLRIFVTFGSSVLVRIDSRTKDLWKRFISLEIEEFLYRLRSWLRLFHILLGSRRIMWSLMSTRVLYKPYTVHLYPRVNFLVGDRFNFCLNSVFYSILSLLNIKYLTLFIGTQTSQF